MMLRAGFVASVGSLAAAGNDVISSWSCTRAAMDFAIATNSILYDGWDILSGVLDGTHCGEQLGLVHFARRRLAAEHRNRHGSDDDVRNCQEGIVRSTPMRLSV